MIVKDIIEKFDFKLVAGENGISNIIEGVYVGDLLSWVMGRAKEGSAWVTIQGHVNIIAVALLVGASCIIVAEKAEVSPETIEKANSEDIPILRTKLTSYDVAKLFVKEDI